MNIQEFSEQFDTLYNQQYYVLFSMQNPVALDEFEKSVFLTRAQENIVETLYRAGYGIPEGFEKTEYARRILSPLVINDYGRDVATIQTTEAIDYTEHVLPYVKVSGSLSQIFLLNFNMVGIIYEHAVFGGDDPCAAGRTADIIPVKHDDLNRLLRNPHRGPSLRRVLRLDHSGNLENSDFVFEEGVRKTIIELVSKYPVEKYFVRYIRLPNPIILTNLWPEGIENSIDLPPSINGEYDMMECELNPAVHRTILEEAVKLALASKTLNTIPTVPQPKESKNKDAGE